VTITVQALADGDGDGLPDSYENAHACLNAANGDDGAQDQDEDGLSALDEYRLGANACLADSDDDGYDDGAEVRGGSDPLDAASVPLPELAAQPEEPRFAGCMLLPPPAAQTIALSAAVPYSTTTDAAWLHAVRLAGGNLHVSVSCADVGASPLAGSILLTADGRQPLVIPVMLQAGTDRIYLPMLTKRRP